MSRAFKFAKRSMDARARDKRAASASSNECLTPNSVILVNDGKTTYIRTFTHARDTGAGSSNIDNCFNNGVTFGRGITVINNAGSCSINHTSKSTFIYTKGNDTVIQSTGNVTVSKVGVKR